MNVVMAWAGFLGAWLLVGAALYQGALELREEEVDRDGIEAAFAGAARPEPVPAWWWLLPPAWYLIRRRRRRAFRKTVTDQLTPEQQEQYSSFVHKAAGWFAVALGASLLAVEQTWYAVRRQHAPGWLFWVLVAVLLALALLNTTYWMEHGENRQERAQRRRPARKAASETASPPAP